MTNEQGSLQLPTVTATDANKPAIHLDEDGKESTVENILDNLTVDNKDEELPLLSPKALQVAINTTTPIEDQTPPEAPEKKRSRYGDLRLAQVLYLDAEGAIHDYPVKGATPLLQLFSQNSFDKSSEVAAYRDHGLSVEGGLEDPGPTYKEDYPVKLRPGSSFAILRLVNVIETKEVREVQTTDVTYALF